MYKLMSEVLIKVLRYESKNIWETVPVLNPSFYTPNNSY